MATTEALKRARDKYEKDKIDRILLRVPKGAKTLFQEYAQGHGESLNGFILRAIQETIERELQESDAIEE